MSSPSTPHQAASLLAILLLPSVLALPPAGLLLERQLTCAASGLASCPSSLPSTFCCPSSQSCIPLAGGTTALCCPEGDGCAKIQPITCDISLQDPANRPDATVKTTFLDGELAACGKGCCPFGYTCNSESQCVRDADQSVLPEGAAPPQISQPSLTISPQAPAQETNKQGNAPATGLGPSPSTNNDDSSSSSPSGGAIAGVVLGVLAGVSLTAFLLFWLLRRRRSANPQTTQDKSSTRHRRSRSSSSFGPTISEPIPQEGSMLRSDFMLKTPTSTPSNSPPRRSPGRTKSGRILPLFRRDSLAPALPISTHTTGSPRPITPENNPQFPRQVAPIRSMKTRPGVGTAPVSRTAAPRREPSGVSINIFADPDTVGRETGDRRFSVGTTFTELMEKADLAAVHHGEPFLPGPSPALRR